MRRQSRTALLEELVKTFCRDITGIREFYRLYQEELTRRGLERQRLALASCENEISTCDYALWSQFHRLRYYPIREGSFDGLFRGLNLHRYRNREISTLKLWREYPSLMEAYDIRNEYELHNLMRKTFRTWNTDPTLSLTFHKMPALEIGKGDRDRQVLDLYARNAPISKKQLAILYEEEYGIRAATAVTNYFGCLARRQRSQDDDDL